MGRREAKDKGERERHIQLNADSKEEQWGIQRLLNEQCKEIEEQNKTGMTTVCFKKLEISRKYFMKGWAW